jgi:hypothetical protein
VLVREALYREMDVQRRASQHLQVATLLENGAGSAQALSEIAHHRLAALPSGDAATAATAARVAAEQAMSMLAFEDAAILFERAEQTLSAAGGDRAAICAWRAGDDEVLRGVLSHAGSALADYAEPSERAPLSEELARLAAAAGDRVSALRAQSRLVFDYAEMGRLDRSARAVDEYQALARDLRQPRHLWPERLMRAMLALATGRLDDADRFHAQAIEGARGDRQVVSILTLAMHSLGRALATDRPDDLMRAEDDLARAERELTELFKRHALGYSPADMWRIAEATLQARAGEVAIVKRCLA